MVDKSSTHQKVTKNGHEGWIVQPEWDKMVEAGNTNGFHAVANTPPEVQILKQKNKEVVEEPEVKEPLKDAPEDVDDTLTMTEDQEVKTPGKRGPKPKQ